jgi:MFS family permease
MTKNLKHNVKNNYIFSFLISLSLTESIWMLFLAYRGMSLWEIGLLESIYHIFSLSFEMPTGMIADRFGRRLSRTLGRVMTFLACLIMLGSHSFSMFAIAFLFTALGNNLESGAGDALIYDSLLELGEENGYKKIKGRQEMFFQTAKLSSLIVGGYVATHSYELAYGITALIHFSSIFQSLCFVEPTIGCKAEAQGSFTKHMADSFKAIWANRHVFRYMLFVESFALFYTTLFFYMQNYMKLEGMTEFHIGLVLAATSLLGLTFSLLAHRIEPLLGQKRLILLSSVAILGCLFGIGFTPYAVPFFLGMAVIDGLLYVAFSDYVNQLIPSEYRATLLSFESMLFSVMMILLFPVVGWVSQTYGFAVSFKLLFVLGVPVMVNAVWGMKTKPANR